jgi:hypothetical protein
LTPTGLLMEGVYTRNPSFEVNECRGCFANYRHPDYPPIPSIKP